MTTQTIRFTHEQQAEFDRLSPAQQSALLRLPPAHVVDRLNHGAVTSVPARATQFGGKTHTTDPDVERHDTTKKETPRGPLSLRDVERQCEGDPEFAAELAQCPEITFSALNWDGNAELRREFKDDATVLMSYLKNMPTRRSRARR